MSNFKSIALDKASVKEIFSKEVTSVEELLNKEFLIKNSYMQGIVYNYDSVVISDIESMEIEVSNIMEARFFNEKKEIVFICEDAEFTGYCVEETSNEMVFKEVTEIYSRDFSKFDVKKYLAVDEDGQAYIKYLKPCKLYK